MKKDHPPIAPCFPEIKEDEDGMWVSGVDPSHPDQKKITRHLIAALQRCAWMDQGIRAISERQDPEDVDRKWIIRSSECSNNCYAWEEWFRNEN